MGSEEGGEDLIDISSARGTASASWMTHGLSTLPKERFSTYPSDSSRQKR